MKNEFYIYGLFENGIPFYIGKGSGRRAKDHINIARRGSNLPVHKKIRSMIDDPEIKILAKNLSEKEAYFYEEKLIKKIGMRRLRKGPLLNLSIGGYGGTKGYAVKLTPEQAARRNKALRSKSVRKKISEGVKKSDRKLTEKGRNKIISYHKNKVLSQETKNKISESKKGKPGFKKTKEQRLAISERNKGRTLSAESRLKISESVKKTGMTEQQEINRLNAVLKKIECPYCHRVGARSIMMRWHFENCKMRYDYAKNDCSVRSERNGFERQLFYIPRLRINLRQY